MIVLNDKHTERVSDDDVWIISQKIKQRELQFAFFHLNYCVSE